jgi:hypothetical protein
MNLPCAFDKCRQPHLCGKLKRCAWGGDEDWSKTMACVYNNLGDCIAKIPEACQCQKLPELEYRRAVNQIKRGDR